MSEKTKPAEFKAGQNVIAKIDGKEIELYCVQICDGRATLQGGQEYVVPVADVIRAVG